MDGRDAASRPLARDNRRLELTGAGMTCEKCGTEMNHQADKLVHPVTAAEAASMTPALDGVIEVVFACQGCGRIDSRREAGPPSQRS